MKPIQMDNYAKFGVELHKAVSNNADENSVWRHVVRAHIRLGITDPAAIKLARQIVENRLQVSRLTAPSH